ncbi:MAG: alpha/beta hydrolase family protein, partial [Spongiibacteraceae bacterium]
MAKFLKVLAVLVALLAVAGIILATAKQPPALMADSLSVQRLQPGPYSVGHYDEVVIDSSRRTQANGDYAGADSRRLASTIWYPEGKVDGGFPLIVHSHGFSSNRSGGEYLARQLASHGYVVIAADFPLTNALAPGGPLVKDVVNQPGDVSFLIDTVLRHSRNPQHVLAAMVDPDRIGAMGISLGGMTTTLAAYHPNMADPRIRAAVSIAGPTDQFNEAMFRQRSPAFLMLGGTVDALVPYQNNALPVLKKIPDAQLVTIADGSHMGFIGSAGLLRWMKNPDAIGCYMVMRNLEKSSGEESWLHLLGSTEQGINQQAANDVCTLTPLPEAMNPLRQHQITQLAVRSFFDSELSKERELRDA